MAVSTYLSVITLNINGLNVPIKRHRLADWIKYKTHLYAAYKRLISELKRHRDKVRGWKKTFYPKGNDKKVSIAILISDKVDFKTKVITKEKKGII